MYPKSQADKLASKESPMLVGDVRCAICYQVVPGNYQAVANYLQPPQNVRKSSTFFLQVFEEKYFDHG